MPHALSHLARRADRQHPAGPAAQRHQPPRPRHRTAGAGQGRVLQPGRVGQGPDRGADDRGRRAVRRAQARRHDRRADVGQHRGRAGDRRPSSAATSACSCCRTRWPPDKINTLRAYGAEVVVCPTAVAPEDPRSYYQVSDRLVREIPGAWKPDQYSNPNNPRSHYETHRPGDLGADRRPDHPLRGRRRHRRHHLGHRPLPQGDVGRRPRSGQGDRRRPGGLGVLRRHRPSVPGRGRRRGLLAGRLRPHRRRRDHRGVGPRLLRDDPAAGPRGGPAGRRLVRHGGGRGAAGRRAGRPGRRDRGAAARRRPRATCPRSSPTSG